MTRFLRAVYEIMDEHPGDGMPATKILFVSQPGPEIRSASEGRGIILSIEPDDVRIPVEIMIKVRIDHLVESGEILPIDRDIVVEKVSQKSTHLFQMAHQLLRSLAADECDRSSRQAILASIEGFRSESLEDTYKGYLLRIPSGQERRAAKLIKVMYFANWKLSKDQIQEVLAIELENQTTEDYAQRAASNQLDFVWHREFGSLFKIEQYDDEPVLSFDHSSVERFLQKLSMRQPQVAIYSCADEESGHLLLARLCIRYLLIWSSLKPSDKDLAENDNDEFWALFVSRRFVHYAASFWAHHTRKAGSLITPYLKEIQELLESRPAYSKMCLVNAIVDFEDEDELSKLSIPPPDCFLAQHGLRHALPIFYQPLKSQHDWLQNLFRSKIDVKIQEFRRPINFIETNTGRTALHYACLSGSIETVEYLLDCGAVSVHDKNEETPFFNAVEEGHESISDLLLDRKQASQSTQHPRKLTCLHYACSNNMTELVRVLLGNKEDPNARAFDDWTPVHIAAQNGSEEILLTLLVLGGDATAVKDGGATPLYLAALDGHLSAIRILFASNKDLDPAPQTALQRTPIFAAAQNGHEDVFQFLHSRQPNVPPDTNGLLPIHIASLNGHLSIVKLL